MCSVLNAHNSRVLKGLKQHKCKTCPRVKRIGDMYKVTTLLPVWIQKFVFTKTHVRGMPSLGYL